MKADDIVAALALPADTRVEQRVPKKLLLENGAPTAADKRRINEGVDELVWVAALKPTTIGVPEYRDETREYLEIAVLRLKLRAGSKFARLIELIHRAVPYPVLLISEHEGRVGISAVHKRWSAGEAGATVLDGDVIAIQLSGANDAKLWPDFREALAAGRQPRNSLNALYQGWIDVLGTFDAARITGTFQLSASPQQSAARREALQEHARLEKEIARIRAAAVKERQIPRQMELNLEMKSQQAALDNVKRKLVD